MRATFRLLLCIVGFSTTALSAQESCYERYFRGQGKEIQVSYSATGLDDGDAEVLFIIVCR